MEKWVQNREKLLIVWTSGDKDVAEKMVLMYSGVMMKREYWQEAVLMIWGASVRLVAAEEGLQERLKQIQESGVRLMACVACVEEYAVEDVYKRLGIDIVHTGEYLTHYLKDGWRSITI